MKTSSLLALTIGLATVSSLAAQETLFSRDFEDFTPGGFFSYFGDAGVSGFIDAENADLLFSVTIDSVNGGYFYGGAGITLGSLGTFASLADVTFSFDYQASADVTGGIEVVFKVDGGPSANMILDATTVRTAVSFPLSELTNTSGTFTAADLSSPNLQILLTIQNGGGWPANAGAPGTNTISYDNIVISGFPGTPPVLYTRDQLMELAMGAPVLEKTAEGNFILRVKLKETTDLADPAGWVDRVLQPGDVSVVDGEILINFLPLNAPTQFFRLNALP